MSVRHLWQVFGEIHVELSFGATTLQITSHAPFYYLFPTIILLLNPRPLLLKSLYSYFPRPSHRPPFLRGHYGHSGMDPKTSCGPTKRLIVACDGTWLVCLNRFFGNLNLYSLIRIVTTAMSVTAIFLLVATLPSLPTSPASAEPYFQRPKRASSRSYTIKLALGLLAVRPR